MLDVHFALGCFVFFGIVPLLLALFSQWWFWKLPLVSKLWPNKLQWDATSITLPTATLLLKDLRETDSLGAKTTVAHHLATWANDIRVRLVNAQLRAFATTLIGYGLVAIAGVRAAPSTETPLGDLAIRFLTAYTLPVSVMMFLIEAYTLIMSLIDQARKFEDLLDPSAAFKRR